jgi:uncharacterized membrane protein YgcG
VLFPSSPILLIGGRVATRDPEERFPGFDENDHFAGYAEMVLVLGKRRRAGRLVLALLAFLVLAGWPTLLGGVAQAAPAGEQIARYTVDFRLRPDGSMHVKETIQYSFGTAHRHGIVRTLPLESRYDKDHDREYPIEHIKVFSPTGAPVQEQTTGGSRVTLRIGDPDNTQVTGNQTYVIDYDLQAVVNSLSDHQELYWNAIGNAWTVPIRATSVHVSGPAAVQKVACFEGSRGSRATCQGVIGQDGTAEFSTAALSPGEGATVVASFPRGTFPNAAPILTQRWSLAAAFSSTPVTVGSALGLLLLLSGGAMLLVLKKGRDERYLGLTPGLLPGYRRKSTIGRVPWLRREPIAVHFAPPAGMTPGQLGTLMHERAGPLDIAATIIDLSVRGFLRIEEVKTRPDWRLIKLDRPPGQAGRLSPFEARLTEAIFRRTTKWVLLSTLKRSFGGGRRELQARLEADVTERGWFTALPSRVRRRWLMRGLVMTLVGVALTGWLAAKTHFGLLGIAVVASGGVLMALSSRMPARTAQGTSLLAHAKGFGLYLEKAEAHQIRFEEGQDIFSRYLPYAIVLGVAERWAEIFAGLARNGAPVVLPTWYSGALVTSGVFQYQLFVGAMDGFADAASSSFDPVPATPTASGSSQSSGWSGAGGSGYGGSAGGGDGGGGGGSW